MSDFSKKVKIQTFKKMEKMTEKDAEELWKGLESAFNEIYNRNSTALSYEAIYRFALRSCYDIFMIYQNGI